MTEISVRRVEPCIRGWRHGNVRTAAHPFLITSSLDRIKGAPLTTVSDVCLQPLQPEFFFFAAVILDKFPVEKVRIKE